MSWNWGSSTNRCFCENRTKRLLFAEKQAFMTYVTRGGTLCISVVTYITRGGMECICGVQYVTSGVALCISDVACGTNRVAKCSSLVEQDHCRDCCRYRHCPTRWRQERLRSLTSIYLSDIWGVWEANRPVQPSYRPARVSTGGKPHRGLFSCSEPS